MLPIVIEVIGVEVPAPDDLAFAPVAEVAPGTDRVEEDHPVFGDPPGAGEWVTCPFTST